MITVDRKLMYLRHSSHLPNWKLKNDIFKIQYDTSFVFTYHDSTSDEGVQHPKLNFGYKFLKLRFSTQSDSEW